MLVNLKEILGPAREGKYAVGHFNTLTLEMARGVLAAAEEQNTPVILAYDEQLSDICPMEEFISFALPMAKNAKVPVAVHYDHGCSFDGCIAALKAGFTSVDYDCSEENFEENVRKVAELTHTAHVFGASGSLMDQQKLQFPISAVCLQSAMQIRASVSTQSLRALLIPRSSQALRTAISRQLLTAFR